MRHVYKGLAVETPSTLPRPSALALLTLVASAAANSALAIYQWRELFSIRSGGTAACSINETVNCAAVWSSPFASKMHDWFGMPVAGLGLVWALTAVVLAGLVAWRVGADREVSMLLGSVKVTALVGVLACITFASASFAAGALCLTCLGTYALVAVYAFGAFVLLPRPMLVTDTLGLSVASAAVIAAPIFLGLLWVGQKTPKAVEAKISATAESSDSELSKYLEQMPQAERQFTADARARWLAATKPPLAAPAARALLGAPTAPVAVVEFTDILCSHCKQLEQMLSELRRVLPEGRLSIDARQFPLDGECNSMIPKVWGDGIRCLAARAQVCLEGTPALWPVKRELFDNQAVLTKELILETATRHSGLSRESLLACVVKPETQARIDEDIAYAQAYSIEGTPLVLINGKESMPAGGFLLALAINGGNPDAPFFRTLPPPSTHQ